MLKKRNMTDFPIDELIILHKRRGDVITKTQKLRRQKNLLSETIASKKRSKEDASLELDEMKQVSMQLHSIESEAIQIRRKVPSAHDDIAQFVR